jgi:hypothetical protein
MTLSDGNVMFVEFTIYRVTRLHITINSTAAHVILKDWAYVPILTYRVTLNVVVPGQYNTINVMASTLSSHAKILLDGVNSAELNITGYKQNSTGQIYQGSAKNDIAVRITPICRAE